MTNFESFFLFIGERERKSEILLIFYKNFRKRENNAKWLGPALEVTTRQVTMMTILQPTPLTLPLIPGQPKMHHQELHDFQLLSQNTTLMFLSVFQN